MATIRLPHDFKDFLRLLDTHDVDYLLVGGYAVGYHGYPRATADMDIWVSRTHENARKLVAVLQAFGFSDAGSAAKAFTEEGLVIRLGVPPLRIEIITSASGLDFDVCHAQRVEGDLDGVRVSILSLSDLKRNKKAAGRPKDLADLDELP